MLRAMDPASEPLSCQAACLAAGEPLAGTASDAPWFAAISWPKPLWHADKVALSEGLPAQIGALEKSAKQSGRKLQLRLFQRAGATSRERVEVLCADFAARRSASLRDVAAAEAAAVVSAFLEGREVGPPLASPLALVCTDGKHDACCGKLGRSALLALRAEGVDAVEASHLGGHRLAANCLALPTGRLYGRVGPEHAAALAHALRHDAVYLPCYRGRSGLDELAQVAEAAALGRFPSAAAAEVGDRNATTVQVELRDGEGVRRVEIACGRRSFRAIASCGDSEPETRERWVAL